MDELAGWLGRAWVWRVGRDEGVVGTPELCFRGQNVEDSWPQAVSTQVGGELGDYSATVSGIEGSRG